METTSSDIRYAEPVLKRLTHKYASMGLAIAVVCHFAFVGAFWTSEYFTRSDGKTIDIPVGPIFFVPPPSIKAPESVVQIDVSGPAAKPDAGIPVPAPDALVSIDKTIPTQGDYNTPANPGSTGSDVTYSTGTFNVPDDDVPPPVFRPVEEYPQVVHQAIPKYPELAQRAGIEGKVIVKVWVDKNGNPRQAIVLKSSAEILNQSAVDAAMAYRFTLAIMNKGPVSIWITIPFEFKLKQGL